jgi:uncharacterized protein
MAAVFPPHSSLKPTPGVGKQQERIYRHWMEGADLIRFQVKVKETDLQIAAQGDFSRIARESVLTHRGYLEAYIAQHPQFSRTLKPWPDTMPGPEIVTAMITAGRKAGVGPMAAVAGAIAECVGRDLLPHSAQVIVENGGDIFMHAMRDIIVGVYAGDSPLSGKIGIRITADAFPMGVCTSSASIGHSLSLGAADAACILSKSCALADAAATAVGNAVKSAGEIDAGLALARRIDGVSGAVIIVGRKIGVWGALELVPLHGKKG